MLIFANFGPEEDLHWSDDRMLLTVTSTFAYHREMRWVWLWLVQFVSVMILSNVRTVGRHFMFFCEMFQVSPTWCYYLQISEILWPLSLSAIVIFIQGRPPKMQRSSDISKLIWSLHYIFVILMVIGVLGVMISVNTILKKSPKEIQKAHRYVFKRVMTGGFLLCAVSMITLGITATLKDPMGENPESTIYWDCMTGFEYISILLIMLYNLDVFAGMRNIEKVAQRLSDKSMDDSFMMSRKTSMTPII